MADLRLVVLDPLQPLCALDLNVPENAQFVCSRLTALAARTGAAVIVSHHFAKREATTPEQAREAIRGTGGLVDGVRSVYALWQPKEEQARTLCKTLGEPFERGRVVLGGVVKANGQADLHVTTFLRDARGLLVDRSQDVRRTAQPDIELLPALKAAIARAAAAGQPYTKTGGNGIYERRHELPQAFQSIGKHRQASADRVGERTAGPRGTGDGDGRRLQAGEMAGCARWASRQRRGAVRDRAPGALVRWPPMSIEGGEHSRCSPSL